MIREYEPTREIDKKLRSLLETPESEDKEKYIWRNWE